MPRVLDRDRNEIAAGAEVNLKGRRATVTGFGEEGGDLLRIDLSTEDGPAWAWAKNRRPLGYYRCPDLQLIEEE